MTGARGIAVVASLLAGFALLPGCGRGILFPPLPGAGDGAAGDGPVDQAPVDHPSVDHAPGDVPGGPDGGPVDMRDDRGPSFDGPPDVADAPVDRPGDAPAPDRMPDVAPDLRFDSPPDLPSRDVPSEALDGGNDAPLDGGNDGPPDAGRDTAPDCGSLLDIHHCGSCSNDCTKLPNVSLNALYCFSGGCYAYACLDGYMQCQFGPNKGCEVAPATDPKNCGGCGIVCGLLPGSPGICKDGTCVGECPDGYGDCTPEFGCETPLDSPQNCGACGRPACDLANVDAPCNASQASCDSGICVRGYGNCATATADCEAAYGTPAGSCFPKYRGTPSTQTGQSDMALAVAADGAWYVGGAVGGSADLDPTTGIDQRAIGVGAAYVTKMNADGSYAWTQIFVTSSYADVLGLTATADGGVVAVGVYQGIIDLDPSDAGTSYHSTISGEPFVVKLAADGSLVWGDTFQGADSAYGYAQAVTAAADGSLYVIGQLSGGAMDFDPGPGVVSRTASDAQTMFVVKLTGAGALSWVDFYDLSFTPNCGLSTFQFAAAPDGTLWGAGAFNGACDFDPGSGITLLQSPAGNSATAVLAIGADGRSLGAWTFGGDVGVSADAIAVDATGIVYVAGTFIGTVDFDPGAGVANRQSDAGAAYVTQLNPNGAFRRVETLSGISMVNGLALPPDGSIVVAGELANNQFAAVVEINADRSRGWTLPVGADYVQVARLVAGPKGFLVGGFNSYQDEDFDPAPDVEDIVPGYSVFVSRFDY